MKPKEKKPNTVYRIINKNDGTAQGSYSRACCDEYDFSSVSSARSANCHDVLMDEDKYKIAKYKVTYELIEDDCPLNEDWYLEKQKEIAKYKEYKKSPLGLLMAKELDMMLSNAYDEQNKKER